MNAWLNLLRDLFLFRRGPADVPYSPALLWILLVLMVVVDVVSTKFLREKPFGVGPAAAYVGIGVALLYGLLRMNGKQARFVQAAAAMMMTRLVVVTLIVLIMLGAAPYPLRTEDYNPEQIVLTLLSAPLVIWYIALRVHIVRHALDIPVLRSLAIVLLMTVMHLTLIGMLFPEPA